MSALTNRVSELIPNARLHKVDSESNDIIIWGPPGTGKTTSLKILLDAHLRWGHEPDRILVNAFTRNATYELRRRILSDFGVEMPWLRTIHSSCFALLGLASRQVVQRRELELFGAETGYRLKGVLGTRSLEDPYGGVNIQTPHDWFYVAEELRRQRMQTVPELVGVVRPHPVAAGEWTEKAAMEFSHIYVDWKRQKGLYDFADMLELVLRARIRPPVDQLFIDEAQDSSPLIWAVVDLWRQGAERTFTFGDDDQSIFEWMGADPRQLWRRPGHQFVLSHSFRLPSAIHAEAQGIIKRTATRVEKVFEPDREGGDVDRAWAWADVDVSQEGSWFLLCRNRVFLDELRRHLIQRRVAFKDRANGKGIPDPDSGLAGAVDTLWKLHAGAAVSRPRLRTLRRWLKDGMWPEETLPQGTSALVDLPQSGASPELVRLTRRAALLALDLEPAYRDYLGDVLRRDGHLSAPRLEISTVHGVKGEEADHVVVGTAWTNRTNEEWLTNPDAEHRVFYVGATRARQSLTWLVTGGKGYVV